MGAVYGYNSPVLTSTGLIVNLDASNKASYNPTQNLILYSNDFLNSSVWNKTDLPVTVVANATTDPFGGNNAYSITNPSAMGLFYQAPTISAVGTGKKYCSVYAKANTANIFTFNCYYGGDSEKNITFTLTGNGSFTGESGNHSIEKIGNDGWYRCTVEVPARQTTTGTVFYWRIWPSGRPNTTLGCFFYGAQIRDGSVSTSPDYVATTSAVSNIPNTWYNLAGSSFNATLTGTTYDTDNLNSIKLSNFNNNGVSNSFIEIQNTGVNPMSQDNLTVEIVCKFDRTDYVWERVFDFGRGGNNTGAGVQAMVLAKPGAEYNWALGTNGTYSQYVVFDTNTRSSDVNFGKWEYFSFTWKNGEQRLYRSGELVASSSAAHSTKMSFEAFGTSVSLDKFWIGRSNWNDGSWNGNFLMFKIYNTVLTPRQIKENVVVTSKRLGI